MSRSLVSWFVVLGLAAPLPAQAPPAPDKAAAEAVSPGLPVGARVRLGQGMSDGSRYGTLAFSRDGTQLAVAGFDPFNRGDDTTIHVWDLVRGGMARQLVLPPNRVGGLVFAPDGKRLASSGQDGTITIWDLPTGKELRQITPAQGSFALVFAPDGKTLATAGNDRVIRLWDVDSGKELRALDPQRGYVFSLAFTPDGRSLAGGSSDGSLRWWDVATGKEQHCCTAHRKGVGHVSVAPDGRTIASGSYDGTVRLWETATGNELRCLRLSNADVDFNDQLSVMAFSADGKVLVTGGGNRLTFRLWDPATGEERRQLTLENNSGYDRSAFAPGALLVAVSTSQNQQGGVIQVYDLTTGQERKFPGHAADVSAVIFAPDGRTVATGSADHTIRLWDSVSGKELRCLKGHTGNVSALAFSPDGRLLASACSFGDMAISLWDVAEGKELRQFRGPDNFGNVDVAFTGDGKTLSVCTANRQNNQHLLWHWDVATGKARPSTSFAQPATGARFSADGKQLIVWGANNQVLVWDVAAAKEVARINLPQGTALSTQTGFALSPDGKRLVAETFDQKDQERKRAMRLFDAATGKMLHQLGEGLDRDRQIRFRFMGATVSAAAFSPDSRTVATTVGEQGYRAIRLWDTATGKQRQQFVGHVRMVKALTFSPDGTALASASADGTGVLWDVYALEAPAPKADALTDKDLATLDADLGGTDSAKAYQAIARLIRSPKQAVAFIQERLKPVPAVDAEQLAAWIGDLANADAKVHEAAARHLEGLSERAESPLRKALEDKPAEEIRKRIDALLKRIGEQTLSGDQLRALRQVEILEHIGTPEAQQVVRKVAAGAAGARLTVDADAALKRLAARQ